MRSEFCPMGTSWPEWAIYIVGISGGFQCFESEEDGIKWLDEFHKKERLEPKLTKEVSHHSNDDDEPVRKVITGFAA